MFVTSLIYNISKKNQFFSKGNITQNWIMLYKWDFPFISILNEYAANKINFISFNSESFTLLNVASFEADDVIKEDMRERN